MPRATTMRSLGKGLIWTALAVVMFAVTASGASAASWVAHSLNFPSGIVQEELLGIGCASTTICTAVGKDSNGSTGGAHAESGAGSGWTFQSGVTRNPGPKNGVLYGSSCPSTTWCMTVGSYGNSSGKPAAMAQVKNGSTWSLYNIGIPSGTQAELNAVSCTSSTFCMAVGYKMVSGDDKPFAMVFNGSSWAESSATTATNATLKGISCPTSTYCMAVGSTGGSALAEVWNSGVWSTTSAVVLPPEGSSYQLNGVSCVSSTWCLTVGVYKPGGGNSGTRGISSRWNGSSWNSVGNLVAKEVSQVVAYGVSCVSTSVCLAVGTVAGKPFANYYFGGWSEMSLSLPAGASGGELRGISCVSETHCEASGWSYFGGTPTGLIETYS